MQLHFVGMDVHKQTISHCMKRADGRIVGEGIIQATRGALDEWVQKVPKPWIGGMESTMFSHWIYRHLEGHAERLLMGHSARMKAICSGKKKSDRIDASTIADLLRSNLFPACYVISPELGALRQQLRFRRLVVEEMVKFKNKTAGLLMSAGVQYERRKLHGKRYYGELVKTNAWINAEMKPLLEFSRIQIETLQSMDNRLLQMLERHPLLQARVKALQSIQGVGPVTALTWALETGTPARFASIDDACSYCGLTSALWESAGKQKHGPISKQRNPHLQSMLIDVAKIAPMTNEKLQEVHRKSREKGGHKNIATLEVARKLVAYLLAVDRAFSASQSQAERPRMTA